MQSSIWVPRSRSLANARTRARGARLSRNRLVGRQAPGLAVDQSQSQSSSLYLLARFCFIARRGLISGRQAIKCRGSSLLGRPASIIIRRNNDKPRHLRMEYKQILLAGEPRRRAIASIIVMLAGPSRGRSLLAAHFTPLPAGERRSKRAGATLHARCVSRRPFFSSGRTAGCSPPAAGCSPPAALKTTIRWSN